MLHKESAKMALFQPYWKKYPNLSPAFKRFDQYFRTIQSISRKQYEIKVGQLNNMKDGKANGNREHSGICLLYTSDAADE